MTRWHLTIVGAALATLCAFECNEHVPGSAIPHSPATESWHAAVDAVAEDWASEPTLPSIDRARCDDALAELELRTASEREWVQRFRLCPRMPDGCSTLCGGRTTCYTGTVSELRNRWRVYLSPGEDASGHAITVRHEVAHILHACAAGSLDVNHTNPLIWRGANSVVWRDYGQSPVRVACAFGGG